VSWSKIPSPARRLDTSIARRQADIGQHTGIQSSELTARVHSLQHPADYVPATLGSACSRVQADEPLGLRYRAEVSSVTVSCHEYE
jgi:hypothetical protein